MGEGRGRWRRGRYHIRESGSFRPVVALPERRFRWWWQQQLRWFRVSLSPWCRGPGPQVGWEPPAAPPPLRLSRVARPRGPNSEDAPVAERAEPPLDCKLRLPGNGLGPGAGGRRRNLAPWSSHGGLSVARPGRLCAGGCGGRSLGSGPRRRERRAGRLARDGWTAPFPPAGPKGSWRASGERARITNPLLAPLFFCPGPAWSVLADVFE